MAGVSLTGDWKKVQRMIGSTIKKMEHRQTLTETIGEALVSSTKERFDREERPDGTPWPKSQRAEQEGGQTLTDRGVLKDSIGYEASKDMVAVGTVEIYGRIHQLGGEIVPQKAKRLVFEVGGKKVFAKKVTIPERAYLGISDDDREEIMGIAEDFLAGDPK